MSQPAFSIDIYTYSHVHSEITKETEILPKLNGLFFEKKMTDHKPINPHPGQFLKSEIIKPRKLTVRKSAELLAVTEDHLHKIITGTRDINLGMCCRLEQLFGENAEVWATRQMLHDLEKKRAEVQKLNIQPYKAETLKI